MPPYPPKTTRFQFLHDGGSSVLQFENLLNEEPLIRHAGGGFRIVGSQESKIVGEPQFLIVRVGEQVQVEPFPGKRVGVTPPLLGNTLSMRSIQANIECGESLLPIEDCGQT